MSTATRPSPGRSVYPDYCSIREAATLLGLHPRTVRRAVSDGELQAKRLRGSLLIPIQALRNLQDVEPDQTDRFGHEAA